MTFNILSVMFWLLLTPLHVYANGKYSRTARPFMNGFCLLFGLFVAVFVLTLSFLLAWLSHTYQGTANFFVILAMISSLIFILDLMSILKFNN